MWTTFSREAEPRGRFRVLASDPAHVYSRPCFSPDGDRVLVMRAPAGPDPVAVLNADAAPWTLWTIPVDGGEPVELFADPGLGATRPDWSPRSRRIAFTGTRGGQAELWVLDEDGGNPLRVPIGAPANSRIFYPSWCPDGSSVAVTDFSTRRVLRVDLVRGAVVPLTDPAVVWAGMSAVSPLAAEGLPLVFAGQRPRGRYRSNRNSIWIQPREGAPRPLDRNHGRMPSWAPDGRFLAFASIRGRPAPLHAYLRHTIAGWRASVFVQPLASDVTPNGSPYAVTPPGWTAAHPRWSPDGARLTCMFDEPSTGRRGIAVIEVDDRPRGSATPELTPR